MGPWSQVSAPRERNEHRNGSLTQDSFGRRSKKHFAVATQAVGGDNDQLCVLALRQRDDLSGGVAH
jgi:DUF2934 family protein